MKRILLLVLLTLSVGVGSSHAEVLTAFSDQGVPGTPQGFNPIDTFPNPQPSGVVYTTAPLAGVPEGKFALQTMDQNVLGAGWAITWPAPQDLSRFNNGEFRFWVYSSTGNVTIQLQNSSGSLGLLMQTTLSLLGWSQATMANKWVLMRIGLAPVNLTNVQHPGVFFAPTAPATFYIDNVHFITATTAPNFTVTIKNRSDNTAATQVTWNTAAPSGWALADQYVSVEADSTVTSWGVQVYTNNTISGANPHFTGVISSQTATPAGLVNTTDTSTTIPLAWATRSDTSSWIVPAADPNSGTPDSFQWLTMEDHAQVAVPTLNAAAFADNDPFVVTRNNVGIHFSQDSNDFGPADEPYRIYLETNLGAGLAQQTYRTSTLTLELFFL